MANKNLTFMANSMKSLYKTKNPFIAEEVFCLFFDLINLKMDTVRNANYPSSQKQ